MTVYSDSSCIKIDDILCDVSIELEMPKSYKAYPQRVLLTMLEGWMNRLQQEVIEYLKTEKKNHKIFAVKWIGLTCPKTGARNKVRNKHVRLVSVCSSPVLRSLS